MTEISAPQSAAARTAEQEEYRELYNDLRASRAALADFLADRAAPDAADWGEAALNEYVRLTRAVFHDAAALAGMLRWFPPKGRAS